MMPLSASCTAALKSVPFATAASSLRRDRVERFGEDGVDRHHRTRDRLPGAHRAELEAVAGEGEGAGAVAIARVLRERRQRVDADRQMVLGLRGGRAALGDLLEDVGELLAEEDRDDRGRRLVGPEAVVVRRRRDDRAQQGAVLVDCADHGAAEDQELRVLVGRLARIEQVALRRVADREVDVLARAVDPREGLLVQQAGHPVLLGDALQRDHQELLVIGRDVGVLEDRRDFVLSRCHLVVARLHRDAELEELALGVDHEREHALGDRAEVLVLELLPLGRRRAEESATARDQVGPREEEMAVDQEVLLLGAREREDRRRLLVAEEREHALRLLVQRLLRAQQRRLLVERLARPRYEGGGNAERRAVGILEQVSRARDVPRRVAACFEGRADASVRKARRIGLALDQRLASELRDRAAVAVGGEERVVLLRGEAGERIEDVGVVRRALLDRPVLHRRRDDVGDRGIELRCGVDGALERLEHRLGQARLHRRLRKHVDAEELVHRDLGCSQRL